MFAADQKKWLIHRTVQCTDGKTLHEFHGIVYHCMRQVQVELARSR
jgi:hypothetical protein